MLPKKTSLAIVTFAALVLLLDAGETRAPVHARRSHRFPASPRRRQSKSFAPPRTVRAIRRESPSTSIRRAEPDRRTRQSHGLLQGALAHRVRSCPAQSPASCITAIRPSRPIRSPPTCARCCQQHFGDAGHGFVLIAKPWAWYGHRGVDVQGKGWHIEAATQARARDGFHGLGGVSFEGDTGAVLAHRSEGRSRAHGDPVPAPAGRRRPGGGSGGAGNRV